MTLILSHALADAQAQAVIANLASGILHFYDGLPTAGGHLLGTGQLPIAPLSSNGAGVLTMYGQWFVTISTSGNVAYATLTDNSGGTFTLTVDVGLAPTGGATGPALVIGNTAVTVGDVLQVGAFTYTVPLTS